MKIFKELNIRGHEQMVFFNDPYSGLKGIIAIHNTTLGPALGGCRMWNYKTDEDAIIDDDSCQFEDECNECGGNGIDEGTCDCLGTSPDEYCIDIDGDGSFNHTSSELKTINNYNRSNIIYINNKINLGGSESRNIGIKNSK